MSDLKVLPRQFREASYTRNTWFTIIEPGFSPKDMLDESVWSHVAAHVQKFDTIEVVPEDASWYASYLVIGSGSNWVLVRLLHECVLTREEEKELVTNNELPEFSVKWHGPNRLFAVVRNSDKALMQSNLETKERAVAWIEDYRSKKV